MPGCSYLFILVIERAPDLQTRVLVGIMDDDVIAISSDVHGRKEFGAMQQQSVTEAPN